jgi:hypothetical protein
MHLKMWLLMDTLKYSAQGRNSGLEHFKVENTHSFQTSLERFQV